MEMIIVVVLGSVLLVLLLLCAIFALCVKGAQMKAQNGANAEADDALSDETPLLSSDALVLRAQRLKTSPDRRERLANSSGKDLTRYFVADADTFLNRRLRQAGIHPDDVDLPPAVAGLEEEILAPPPGANERNDGFFNRNNG